MRRSLPLYVQIESTLRERIVSGRYPAGGAFPTDEKLRQEFGVSRATVRLALDTLHREGLIVRYPGRGSFVNEVRERARTLRFQGSVRDLITQGDVHGPTFTVTHVVVDRALRIRVGASLLTIRRTYLRTDGTPVEFAVSSYAGDTYQYEAIITGNAQSELLPLEPAARVSG